MKLEDKEKIIFMVHPHWLYAAVPELALAILGLVFFKSSLSLPYWISIVLIVALTFAMLMVFLEWFSIKYCLTNLRLIEERGIISKRIVFIPLDKVQDITCKYGILGRIFNFGDLEIESAGTYGKIVFSFIANPRNRKEEIKKAIFEIERNINSMEKKKGK